jgi:hypothetical protein
MFFLSEASLLACVFYIYIGIHAFRIDKKLAINRLFLVSCTIMAIWSFSFSFIYITTGRIQDMWSKVSALGWCFVSATILHLVLIFIESTSHAAAGGM